MVVSKKLLGQWIDIKNINDQTIAQALNNLGFEVQKVINLTKINSNLVVGEILKIEPHPKLAKLNICTVSIGNSNLTIVCGASNVAVGIKVVVAQINSSLANGLTITARNLQGVVSHGMLCSLSELGLHPDVQSKQELAGIVHLPSSALVGNGNPLSFLGLNDTIFEIQLTVNRSDCLALYSVAQELSSYFKIPLKAMEINDLAKLNPTEKQIEVNNNLIMALGSLKIKLLAPGTLALDSSLRRTLQLCQIKPTNFIDDLLNLVMLELGQPMLAFNSEQLKDPEIYTAAKEYTGNLNIKPGDLVFHNKYLPFSVIGLNTIEDYQVKDDTSEILLVAINPDLLTMQQQIKRHNSLASTVVLQRLTKPVVPDYYLVALQRILFLLNQAQANYQLLNFCNDLNYEVQPTKITFNWNRINQILGTKYNLTEMIHPLKTIGCNVMQPVGNDENLTVVVPSHRNDLTNVNDVSEEVARLIGYDSLPIIKPKLVNNLAIETQLDSLVSKFNEYLLNHGFNHVKTYNLTNQQSLKTFNFFNYQTPITLLAPLTSAREVMRFSLIESLASICQTNLAHKQTNLKFFCDDVIYTGDDQSDEHHLAFIVAQEFLAKNLKLEVSPFYLVKGFFESFLKQVVNEQFTTKVAYQPIKNNNAVHPYLSANVVYNKVHFATIASFHPQTLNDLSLPNDLYFVEVNMSRLEKIIQAITVPIKFKNWSKYNPLSRDISMIISNEINFAQINEIISNAKITNLITISLIDLYADEKLQAEAKHSVTINLQFNSEQEQLDEGKISPNIETIQKLVANQLQAIIR